MTSINNDNNNNNNGTSNTKDKTTKKIINDPIHGLMEFDDWVVDFIDTEYFQRLRNIKQLGPVYYVYPGATHSRFEHSLGVAHLAYTLVKRLSEKVEIEEKYIKCATLAALCHDLGHGPFSHLFEKEFIPQATGKKWKHEKGSLMMFREIIKVLKKEKKEITNDLNDSDIKFIEALIVGKNEASDIYKISISKDWPEYLFDIIANNTNGIDVDKFDYLVRDCHYLGIKSVFDSSRLMNFSRVNDDGDHLMYYYKERYNIYELFHTRYSLHKKAYNHRVGKAIDYMICDALVEADEFFGISESIHDPNKFLKMDDTILNRIECTDDKRLEESKKIIQRIRTRKLYKFVDEFSVPPDKKQLAEKKLTAKEIAKHQEGVEEHDVIVERSRLNYGKGVKNPVDYVTFYDKNGKVLDKSELELSYLVPEKYEELNIRVFTREPEKEGLIDKIKKRFQDLKNEILSTKVPDDSSTC